MTSTRKIKSNKKNASHSTGPLTPGGKLRSRHNAHRHGLATRIGDDPKTKDNIECLTAILAEGTNGFERIEQSRAFAECHFDQRRIRAARFDVFLTMAYLENAGAGDFEAALRKMGNISRYATRAFSRAKKALRESTST